MNKTPFATPKKHYEPEPGSIEWMIQEAKRLGYVYADNRFLLWVDAKIGKPVGDLFRSIIVHTRQWMIRNNLPVGKIRLDDLISFVFIGINRTAQGKPATTGLGRAIESIKNSPSLMSWLSETRSKVKSTGSEVRLSKESRLKALKDWIFGSKVVTETGEPKVMYHGTTSELAVFDGMAWGSEDPALASDYAELRSYNGGEAAVMPIYMNIQNPFDADVLKNTVRARDVFEGIANQSPGIDRGKLDSLLETVLDGARTEESGPHYSPHNFWNETQSLFGREGAKAIREAFTLGGFDGIKYHENGVLTYGAFSGAQIKSAIDETWEFHAVDQENSQNEESDNSAVEPLMAFHGTSVKFNKFDSKFSGSASDHPASGLGFHFATDPEVARFYAGLGGGDKILQAKLHLTKPRRFDYEEGSELFDDLESGESSSTDIKIALEAQGYNGIIFEDEDGNPSEIVAFDSHQIEKLGYLGEKLDIDTPKWMKDQLENIDHEQTNNAEFNSWFGDSKVVDADGKPLVVYHGEHRDWTQANNWTWATTSKAGASGYAAQRAEFTQNRGEADTAAYVMPLYMAIGNPLVVDAKGQPWASIEWRGDLYETDEIAAIAIDEGYDGAIFRNVADDIDSAEDYSGDNLSDVYVAFRPEQIKSATGNNGQFDPANPDIRYSKTTPKPLTERQFYRQYAQHIADRYSVSAQTDTPEFKRWFGDSKVVNGQGKPMVVYHGTTADFDAFTGTRKSPAFFFAERVDGQVNARALRPSGSVMPTYLSIKNPASLEQFMTTGQKGPAAVAKALMDQGYDGVHWENEDDGGIWVAFKPEQIKSATGNNGQFDPSNPDIRYSKTTPKPLTERQFYRQYAQHIADRYSVSTQTDTPEFKRWFGVSKVVDADGKPLVVYHGTRHSFDEFKREGRGGRSRLHYFSSDPSVASEYAGGVESGDPNVVPAFVALQNPFMFDAGGALWGSLPLDLFPQKIAKHFNERNILRGRSDQVPRVGFTAVIRSAVAAGYDGVIADNIVDGGGPYGEQNPSKVVVATRPEQIKSATGNNGQFDPENPNILFSRGKPEVSATNFDKWFDGSKVVDENGNPLVVYHGTGESFNEFDIEKFGSGDDGFFGKGFYFGDVEQANRYSKARFDRGASGANVMPVYLSMKNPLIVNDDTGHNSDVLDLRFQYLDKFTRYLDENGHDGVIYTKTLTSSGQVETQYFARTPGQIKSAIGNNGQFNAENPSILFSQSKQSTANPKFDEWFGDSKVVSRSGKPMVMYHRTPSDFDFFDTERGDLGSHFGTAEQAENLLGGMVREGDRTIPVFLSIKNPIRLSDKGGFHADSVAPQLKRLGLIDAATAKRLAQIGDRGTVAERREANREIKSVLEKAGFDGAVYKNSHEGRGDSYIAFHPEQIKSAISNNGQLDQVNSSILFSREFEQHKNTHSTYLVYHGTKEQFADFKTPAWFTPRRDFAERFASDWGVDGNMDDKSRIVTAEITLKNPVKTGNWSVTEPNKEMLDQYRIWEAEGHDGIIFVDEKTQETEFIVFQPEQVKTLKSEFIMNNHSNTTEDWIECTKVVDETGMPLIVYHGSKNPINSFEEREDGIYFTPSTEVAAAYARGYEDDSDISEKSLNPVYLSIKNPLIVTDEWLKAFSHKAPEDPNKCGNSFRDNFVDSVAYARKAVIAEAKSLGYDGLILPNDFLPVSDLGGDWEEQVSYVAFKTSQIRHVAECPLLGRKKDTNISNESINKSKIGQLDKTKHASMLTESALVLNVAKSFPGLLPAVNAILEKGHRGERGGALIVDNEQPYEIAKILSEKTNISEGFFFRNVANDQTINGLYEEKTGMTFILGKNLSPEQGVAVLTHELTHAIQNSRVDDAAINLLKNKDSQDISTKHFLERVEKRLEEANETLNKKEVLAYIIEQAIIEHLTNPVIFSGHDMREEMQ